MFGKTELIGLGEQIPMSERDRTKARIKTLEMALSAVTVASRARSPYEKHAAAELAVEFTERIDALKAQDREPALPLTDGGSS